MNIFTAYATTTPIICQDNELIAGFQDIMTLALLIIIIFGIIYIASEQIIGDTMFSSDSESSPNEFIKGIVWFYFFVILTIEMVSLITGTNYGCLAPQIPPEFNTILQIITFI
jgi:hypothetical protein